MVLLAVDPGRSYAGEKTIGYSVFERDGAEVERGSLSFEMLCQKLVFDKPLLEFRGFIVDSVVIEDFVNDPKSARGGQRNGTSECIGAVEILTIQARVPFTRQRNAILGPAKLLAGYEQTLKHLPHQDSAYLHGYYYLVKAGVLGARGLSDTM